MTFSKEDKAAWMNSEVMHELEKIALEGGLDVPEEAFEPIEEEKTWEDEDDTAKLIDAVEEFRKGDEGEETMKEPEEEELLVAYHRKLTDAIEKLAWRLADESKTAAAYKVERTLQNIKALMEE